MCSFYNFCEHGLSNYALPEGLQIIVLECHCHNGKKQIALEFHTARPFALHKTSCCLMNVFLARKQLFFLNLFLAPKQLINDGRV